MSASGAPWLPHTDEDVGAMLAALKMSSLEELFADIPAAVRQRQPLNLPSGLAEAEVMGRMSSLAAANQVDKVSFLGLGCYDHLVPAIVRHVLGRSEFYTAYTPYQAEISQGILQAMFEFQTLICELTGMDVANASLYDGHTAFCEAAVMALNAREGSDTVLFSSTLHPFTKRVLETRFSATGVKLEEIPCENGITSMARLGSMLGSKVAAVLLQTPNAYGWLEDLTGLADRVHKAGALLAISSHPLSLGLLKPPGQWGADIAVGDGQPLGLPPSLGGPSVGFLATREEHLRRLPGRIVGQSVDREGRRAFLLTLQAREQHIRRARANSNICSNQALAALAVTVYLAAVGRKGLREAGLLCLSKSHYLFDRLNGELSLKPLHSRPFFNEFSLKLPRPADQVLAKMEGEGFWAGVPLNRLDPALPPEALTVAVTEKRTRAELDGYAEAMRRALR